MEWTLGYGATPSSGGVTTLSTSQGGMSGYVPPMPGITNWGMPPLEDAIPWGQSQSHHTGLPPGLKG